MRAVWSLSICYPFCQIAATWQPDGSDATSPKNETPLEGGFPLRKNPWNLRHSSPSVLHGGLLVDVVVVLFGFFFNLSFLGVFWVLLTVKYILIRGTAE